MKRIKKVKLFNYRRFREFVFEPNEHINVIVGDNETGKSTILEAMNLTLLGSVKRVEKIGIDNILNNDAKNIFLAGDKNFSNLPEIVVELYFNDIGCTGDCSYFNGQNNTDEKVEDGIRLICRANENYKSEIMESLKTENYFPFEFYTISFSTFANEGYSGYKRQIKSVFIDSSSANSDYAVNDYIKSVYFNLTSGDKEKNRTVYKSRYHQLKQGFSDDELQDLNSLFPEEKHYKFGISYENNDFEEDLMIYEDNIGLKNRGAGRQVIIKSDFALDNVKSDIILMEEPENHLSHNNMRKLVEKIYSDKESCQIFVTTHNSYICLRLELKNVFILHFDSKKIITLDDLEKETSEYFYKSPPVGILEFILAKKSILVEGPSEFMLMDYFYKQISDGKSPESEGVQILDIRGLSFIRYLRVAKLLGIKVSVITDNDGDYQRNIIDKYAEFKNEEIIKIFSDEDNKKTTFEKVLYSLNEEICNKAIPGQDKLNYMLNNKTESSYLLLKSEESIKIPDYIRKAIEWIRN